MILISHRGNIDGPNKEMENNPEYILNAIAHGYNVEIDLWLVDNKLYLGHDEPQYEINKKFLHNSKLWVHCKNIEALDYLSNLGFDFSLDNPDYFFHDTDAAVLTSNGYIWTYPGNVLGKNSICVLPEWNNLKLEDINCLGICSDYIKNYKK